MCSSPAEERKELWIPPPSWFLSFAYNFVRKKARITIFGMWVTSRWIMERLKYFFTEFDTQGRREGNDVTALGRWAVGPFGRP